jgi:peptide/nickel transport system substrate-binding protein
MSSSLTRRNFVKAGGAGLSLAAIVGLVGCGDDKSAASDSDESESKGSIVRGMTTAPSGVFQPLLADTMYDEAVNALIFSSLLTVDDNGSLVPYLATESKISDDQMTVEYTLSGDAMWSDGEKLTAEDVAFTFTSMCSPDFTGGNSGDALYIKGAKAYNAGEADSVEGIQVTDDTHITIVFEEPRAAAYTVLSTSGILPKHIWEGIEVGDWDAQTDLMNAPVGCGPYKLTDYKSGSYVKFEACDDFFGGEVKTAQIVFQVVNADTLQADLKSGSVDIANVSDMTSDVVDQIKADGADIAAYPNFMFQYCGMNMRKEVFQDEKLRQAFMYATNRAGMVEQLLEGRGEILNAPILPNSWAYPDPSTLESYDYDVDKAKQILDEAGYKDTDGDGILESPSGVKLSFQLDCPTGSTKREQTAQIIQENLKAIGVEIAIASMDFSALMEKVVSNHDFDMYMMGNTLNLDPDPSPYWHSDAISNEEGVQGYNIVGYDNAEVDDLIEQANATLDQDERAEIYAKFAKILNEAVPMLYLYVQDIENAYNAKLTGYKPSTFNEFYEVYNWSL